MGQRQTKLAEIVKGYWGTQPQPKPMPSDILNSKYADYIFQTFLALDGQLSEPPTRFGAWDVSTSRFIIELDEERHFNRYRLKTLQSTFYKTDDYFSVRDYQQYCKDKETICLKTASWGRNWKNASTEKQFSQSDPEGLLAKNGSSRWKQRAYYDFLKDVSSQIMGVPIFRLSIYDTHKGISIDQLLKNSQDNFILELITSKTKTNFAQQQYETIAWG